MNNPRFKNGINFIYNERIINTTPLVIDNYIEVIGNLLIIEGDIHIRCDSLFVNVDFINSTIHIENSSYVEFENCRFKTKNFPSIILEENSNSSLSINKCTFNNMKVSIVANNNLLKAICDSTFKFCKTAIEIMDFIYLENITNNLLFSFRNNSFINILCTKYDFSTALSISTSLCKDNNNGVVMCLCNKDDLIKTTFHFVSSYYELIATLIECTNGATIFLKANIYNGDIHIVNSITLIGEDGAVFMPSSNYKNLSAFTISASYICIKNIEILPLNDLVFRDGIRFSNNGSDCCHFENLKICNVKRRGISIWGKNTLTTTISNCKFRDIINEGIYLFGNVTIKDSTFFNCNHPLIMIFPSTLFLTGCIFKDVSELITVDESKVGEINLDGNQFIKVGVFLSQLSSNE